VVPQLVRLTPRTSTTTDKGIAGDIIGLDDPFGSLVTDIPGEEFKKLGYNLGDKIRVELNKKTVTLPYVKTFMDVPVGDVLLFIDSRDRVGIKATTRRNSASSLPAPFSSRAKAPLSRKNKYLAIVGRPRQVRNGRF
jgi:S-adenosylmethionine hydrolase